MLKLLALANGRENDHTTENSHRKYFLSRMKIKNYNIEIDGRSFYDQSMTWLSNTMKSKKISTGQGNDYTTGCLLDLLIWKELQTNYSWFKQTKSFRCRLTSSSTNYFYRTSRWWSFRSLLHSWKNQKKQC